MYSNKTILLHLKWKFTIFIWGFIGQIEIIQVASSICLTLLGISWVNKFCHGNRA